MIHTRLAPSGTRESASRSPAGSRSLATTTSGRSGKSTWKVTVPKVGLSTNVGGLGQYQPKACAAPLETTTTSPKRRSARTSSIWPRTFSSGIGLLAATEAAGTKLATSRSAIPTPSATVQRLPASTVTTAARPIAATAVSSTRRNWLVRWSRNGKRPASPAASSSASSNGATSAVPGRPARASATTPATARPAATIHGPIPRVASARAARAPAKAAAPCTPWSVGMNVDFQ
jgi:hypothetical protein